MGVGLLGVFVPVHRASLEEHAEHGADVAAADCVASSRGQFQKAGDQAVGDPLQVVVNAGALQQLQGF